MNIPSPPPHISTHVIGVRRKTSPSERMAARSASLVQFSQEARSYSLLMLLCVASYYFFVRLVHEGKRRLVIAYILVTVAGLYAHFFAALIVASQAASLPWQLETLRGV